MSTIKLSIPHQIPRAEAKKRIQEEISRMEREYGGKFGKLEQTWTDDTLDFKLLIPMTTVSGKVIVEDKDVRLEVDVPLPFAMLAGSMKQTIEDEGRRLLSHS